MKQKIEKWWDSFLSLKWWVQVIIVAVIAVGIHNYILHQELAMPKGIGTYGSKVGRPPMKKKKKKKKSKKKQVYEWFHNINSNQRIDWHKKT